MKRCYKEDCFGYFKVHSQAKCIALTEIQCEGCNFYKTKKQYERDLEKYGGAKDFLKNRRKPK